MQYITTLGKVLLAFLVLWGVTRLLARHFVRRTTLFDFISSVVLGSLAATFITQGSQPAQAIVGVMIWGALALSFNWLDLQGHKLQVLFDGKPIVLIENGQVMEENLRKQRLALSHLEGLLRYQGYFDISKVEFAVLETDGHLSVLPKSQHRPLTPQDLGLATNYEGLSTQVVHEGRALPRQLAHLGLDEKWLQQRMAEQGVTDLTKVFAAWVTSDGRLVVDRYPDQTRTGQHAYTPSPPEQKPH